MKKTSLFRRLPLAASAALALFLMAVHPAFAQTMKPGLWEMSNKTQSSSGQTEKAMAEMQTHMATMPPEQKKMMQEMMAKQGLSMSPGAGGAMLVKMCMTKEMVERNELPSQQGDCKTTTTPRVGNTMKMSFVCAQPPSSGEGTVTFISPEAYAMKMTTKSTVQGKPETMTMEGSGKWLSADCGNIKPINVPKK